MPDHNEESLEGLTVRQAAFVREYIIDNNGSQAALRAGYSPSSVGSLSCTLLANPKVADAVAIARAQRLARVNLEADTVLQEMSILALSDISHYVVSEDGQVTLADGAPAGAMGAIRSIRKKTSMKRDEEGHPVKVYDIELTLWDKPAPLKLMGRHVGLFPDRVEHVGRDGGPIETISRVERIIVDVPVQVVEETT